MIKKSHLFFLQISKLCLLNIPQVKILNLNFEKMTVYLTAIFQFNGRLLLHQKGYNDVIHLECSV